MKKLFLIISVSLFLSACGAIGSGPSGSSAEVKPKIGDTVTFPFSREGYGEGTVESIDGSRYKIKYGNSTETKEASDVYGLPKAGAKPALKVGDMVIAKLESGAYWAGVEVISVSDSVVEVKELWRGGTKSLSFDQVIVVRPAAVAEFRKLKGENEFTAKAKQARPHPPAGYKPKVGERVVAEWSGNAWWVGEIVSVSSDKAKLKWLATFPESELDLARIMPFPKAATAKTLPAANSYVLVKPSSDSGQWTYAQVTVVNADSAEVKFANGKTQPIKADEYIALN